MPGNATLTFTLVPGQWKSLTTGQIMTTPGNFTVAVSSQSGGASVSVANQSAVTVTGGLSNLSIDVGGAYNPMALLFKQLVGGGDPTGGSAFGAYTRGLNGPDHILTVKDSGQSGSQYEFYVLVQDPNGDFGLIDPRISNQ
jgi:hypothetical protein